MGGAIKKDTMASSPEIERVSQCWLDDGPRGRGPSSSQHWTNVSLLNGIRIRVLVPDVAILDCVTL